MLKRSNNLIHFFMAILFVLTLLISSCDDSHVNTVTGLQFQADSNRNVTVSWGEFKWVKRDLIGYKIYWSKAPDFPQNSSQSSELSTDANSYVIKGLEPGNWYINVHAVFMRTYNSLGSSSKEKQEGPPSETLIVNIPSTK
jgi:hypothetical protein